MPAITVSAVSKSYRIPNIPKRATIKDMVIRTMRAVNGHSVVDALSGVSFSVERGEALGIVGRNGSGKTTLIRVLAGVCRPDSGDVHIDGHISALTALGVGFHPDLTGRENARIGLLALGLSRGDAEARIDEVIDFSELGDFIDAPTHTYSAGMYMRLAFSVSVSARPDVLLLDEGLAVGDATFRHKCEGLMERFHRAGTTMVLASHNSAEIADRCDVALWLHDGKVAAFGDPANVLGAYGDFVAAQESENTG